MARHCARILVLLSMTGILISTSVAQTGSKPHRADSNAVTGQSNSPEGASRPDSAAVKPGEAESVKWFYDLKEATAAAKERRSLIIVDVYTDWCGWCKRMDQIIYKDPAVVGLSQTEVFLKLNAEDGGQGEVFAGKYGVQSFPTTIILGYDGRVLGYAKGFVASPPRFVEFIKRARLRLGS